MILQNVYEGLTFSHVQFYYNLSASFENLPRNLKISAIIGRLPV